MKRRSFFLIALLTLLYGKLVFAETFPYSPSDNVVGTVQIYQIKQGESLLEVARSFGLGFNQIMEANPSLDPFFPGTVPIIVPTSWIVPDLPPVGGIIINVSEMRLYYVSKTTDNKVIVSYPVGIGSEGTNTPIGTFTVIQKVENPPWRVPASIKKENPQLPDIVPPGDENPLGSHALRLSLGDVLIHGTNRPWGIGRKATHGCIRLYPEHIPGLFEQVNLGTPVTIIRQPIKVGTAKDKIYIEVHRDETLKGYDYKREATQILTKKKLLRKISREKLAKALKKKQGFPVEISPS